MNPIIQTKSLTIGYYDKIVARDISLELHRGTLVSLVGANGIGKSTLLRTLSGLQDPLQGEILLGQKPMSEYTPSALAREIALVLTEKPASTAITAREVVTLGRQPYTDWIGKMTSEDRDIVASAVEVTGIGDLAHKRIGQLSDGQLQKVMIARALAQDTPLIMLDEPSTHLDLMHKLALFRLLRQLSQNGKCILFSTHDIESAIAISDFMIVMNGAKVQHGTPIDLIREGVFSTLFPPEEIEFNPQAVKFVFKRL